MFESLLRKPDSIVIETENNINQFNDYENKVCVGDIELSFETDEDRVMDVFLKTTHTPVKNIRLRWQINVPSDWRFLGDAWERSYGDLEWRGLVPNRVMPWYFLMSNDIETAGYGVKVRPSALCFWQVDSKGITLWLDVRNGARGVVLKDRILKVCSIVERVYKNMDAFTSAQEFCKVMCTDPILPKEPVYGFNNWYHCYGDISAAQVINDTDELYKLVGDDIKNRPFMVIDDGWQVAHRLQGYNGGPWHAGNTKFPDMKELADEIKNRNCKPGIWIRLLHTSDKELPVHWRLKKNYEVLDPSVPEVIEYIKETVGRIVDWGYELIKHDFSEVDLFDCWGFEMNPCGPKGGEWSFADNGRTSAEIIMSLYRAILEATKDQCYVLGCNCIGHLGAGLMHLQRSGDDVSGVCWERTRKYGINTLAFRLPQHKTFFDIDADCVGITDQVPWEYNKQWANLVGKSGTSMFVSAHLGQLSEQQREELKVLFEINSRQEDQIKPLDWMHTICPSKWEINGEIVEYNWYEESGIPAFIV